MTSTERVTTAVEQALFRRAEDGTVSVLCSSLGDEQAEQAWLDLVGPYLTFGTQVNLPSPVHAFSYHVLSDGFAAVLRRTWDYSRLSGNVVVHALLGLEAQLTPRIALSASDWPGWLDGPPEEPGLPRLRLDELWTADVADRLRARALVQGDTLARSLAWLLQSPGTPLGLAGCPEEDRIAITWALLAIAGPVLNGREWTFSTHGDAQGAMPAAITFFTTEAEAAVMTDRIVVDLHRGQGASPQNEYQANALVYRYEYGVDPPSSAPAVLPPPAPVPANASAYEPSSTEPRLPGPDTTMPIQVPTRAATPPWQVADLVRDLVTARDVRALDGALVELEYAVSGVDDRDDFRRALEKGDWAVGTIRRHVAADLRDAVFDRVVQISFGATHPGRATPGARADARRLAAVSDCDDLVRAIARACPGRDLADLLAARWLREHAPAVEDPTAGLGLFGRVLRQTGVRVSPAWERRLLFLVVVVVTFLVGALVGGVLG